MASSGLSGRSNSRLRARLCPVNTGTRTHVHETSRSGRPRILRLSSRNFCSSLVSPLPSSTSWPATGMTLKAIGLGNFTGTGMSTALPSCASAAAPSRHLADLLVQLGGPGEPGARDRLVGRRHDAAQPGRVVQRLQHGHGNHRRAVRVGDDPLRYGAECPAVDLGHDQGNVRVHPPRRRVVDDDGTGAGDTRRQLQRGLGAAREQGDVYPSEICADHVLDHDLAAVPRELPSRRARSRKSEPSPQENLVPQGSTS